MDLFTQLVGRLCSRLTALWRCIKTPVEHTNYTGTPQNSLVDRGCNVQRFVVPWQGFLELRNLLPFSFRRALSVAFWAENHDSICWHKVNISTAQIWF